LVAGAAPRLQIWCGLVRAGPGGFDSHAPPPRRISGVANDKGRRDQ